MILRRLGNKKAIVNKITPHFPPHKIWVEPFFGAGGMFFNKKKAKYNIVNDLDSDVFNLFQVVMNKKKELKNSFYMMPIHSDLLNYWKENKETEPIKKAIRFMLLSNFTFLGAGSSLRHGASGGNKPKTFKDDVLELYIEKTYNLIYDVDFKNWDFRKFISKLSFINDGRDDQAKTFIYNDPPYLSTGNNYSNSFKELDSFDLFEANEKTGCKYAMSEFNHPFILDQVKERNLNVITIGDRQSLKKRDTEILITNYKPISPTLFN